MTPTHVAFMVHMCAAATARASAKAARLYAHERATRHSLRANTLNRPVVIPAPFWSMCDRKHLTLRIEPHSHDWTTGSSLIDGSVVGSCCTTHGGMVRFICMLYYVDYVLCSCLPFDKPWKFGDIILVLVVYPRQTLMHQPSSNNFNSNSKKRVHAY